MDTVQVISNGAVALSTFGLYAICAALAVLAIHLYKRVNALEKEFREALVKQAEAASQSNAELRALVTQTQEIIRANTAAFERFSNAIEIGHRGALMYYYTERFKTKYHGRRKQNIQWIVVHYTGTAAGATANARAIEKPLKDPRSTHYFVDGEQVLATVPENRSAWHVGGPDKQDTPPEKRKKLDVYNGNSIGVDLCEDKLVYDREHRSVNDRDWYFDELTEATAAELIASIMRRHNIALDHVVRHYDVTGKKCPRPFGGNDINAVYKETGNQRWREFKALIETYLNGDMT